MVINGNKLQNEEKKYVHIKGYIYKQKFIFDILANIVTNKKNKKKLIEQIFLIKQKEKHLERKLSFMIRKK